MNTKKTVQTNKTSKAYKIIIFWSVLGIMSVVFIVATIALFARYKPINSLNDVSRLNLAGEALYYQDETVYYVYAYPREGSANYSQKTKDIEPIILEYLNFVKHKFPDKPDKVKKMYLYCVDDASNRGSLVDEYPAEFDIFSSNDYFNDFKLKRSDLPILLRVDTAYIVERQVLKTEIANELQNEMTNLLNVNTVAYLPSNKEENI